MTSEQAIKVLLDEWKCIDRNDGINCDRQCEKCDLVMDSAILKDAYNMAIKALSQEPCERFEWGIDGNVYKITKAKDGKEICQQVCDDAISREAVKDILNNSYSLNDAEHSVEQLPSVSTTKNIVNHGTMNITL